MQIHITEAIQSLEGWFSARTCQLFLAGSGISFEPEGSGFLLQINGIKMIVTAGHVIENGKHNRLFFPNLKSRGFTQFDGIWFPSDRNDNVGNDEDDFAYLLLTERISKTLLENGYMFITLSNIDRNHVQSSSNIYTFLGFKWRKTKRKGQDHYCNLAVISNFGKHLSKINKYDRSKINVQHQRKLYNLKSKSFGISGKLEGMSGGPLWSTSLKDNYDINNPTVKLVGVLHSYDTETIFSCHINRLFLKLEQRNHI